MTRTICEFLPNPGGGGDQASNCCDSSSHTA
jgi:hypothetical protein